MDPSQAYFVPDSHHQVEPSCSYQHRDHGVEKQSRQWNLSSGNSVDSWTAVSPSPRNQFHPPLAVTPLSNSACQPNNDDRDASSVCIFTHCLILGCGEPIYNAAVSISVDTGSITFVRPQSQLPRSLASVPGVSVRYLMPGLWDYHTHFIDTINVNFPNMIMTHPATQGAAITRGLHQTLMAGITSVREVGSDATEVTPLVERGIIFEPKIFGAGGAIGITGGSCDACTLPSDYVYSRQGTSGNNSWPGVSGLILVDGVDEFRTAVRQQIRRGARCIKVVATGGALSTQDNPEYRQYSDAELKALIDEASLSGIGERHIAQVSSAARGSQRLGP